MSFSRRNFLSIAGSSAIILPTTACTFSHDSARDPWHNAGNYEDPMRRALSYALLAPNPHNRQPWIVDLLSENEAMLYCDLERLLPQTDPYSRQIVIGLGCFLEQFRMAAQQFGRQAIIEPFPEGFNDKKLDQRPIAKLTLARPRSSQADPLFAYSLDRRTNRNLYEDKTPDEKILKTITSGLGNRIFANFTNRPDQLEALRDLVTEAAHIEFDTKRTYMESVEAMRIGSRQIRAQPDGLVLEGAMMEALHSLGILNHDSLADQSSAMFRTGRDGYAKSAKSAPAFVWLSTPTNTRLDQINTGAAYLRLCLKTTAAGLAIHPLSQTLQEYREMENALARIHDLLGTKNQERVQMLARIGYAKAVGPSPRWPLEAKIKPT